MLQDPTIPTHPPIGVRWTIGDVGGRGFEALALSIRGARRLFGPRAAYAVCVNRVPVEVARGRVGDVPAELAWHDADGDVPVFLKAHFDPGMAEGVGWKLAPLRLFPDRFELSLDNDCILWSMPQAIAGWLSDVDGRCLMAEDVKACFGQFADQCGDEPRNAGIRGLPPGFDLGAALREVLRRREVASGATVVMTSELDEQGLQTAALSLAGPPLAVSLGDVTICSPFWPHRPDLGACGAHFVGLNARHIPWDYYDRPADAWMADHWARHLPTLRDRVGVGRVRLPRDRDGERPTPVRLEPDPPT